MIPAVSKTTIGTSRTIPGTLCCFAKALESIGTDALGSNMQRAGTSKDPAPQDRVNSMAIFLCPLGRFGAAVDSCFTPVGEVSPLCTTSGRRPTSGTVFADIVGVHSFGPGDSGLLSAMTGLDDFLEGACAGEGRGDLDAGAPGDAGYRKRGMMGPLELVVNDSVDNVDIRDGGVLVEVSRAVNPAVSDAPRLDN
jgi:hypothetical protein